ncbi:hypothetical protein TA3x_000015 [Tundrisphaera sp. TA3]|uniref:hypothetical protein n=1 Tax=Tundrisphaera sp. TA3 TaxID=3435775 RepID=UPI003EBEA0C6
MPRSTRAARTITVDGRRLYWRFGKPSPPNRARARHQLVVFSDVGGSSRLVAFVLSEHLPYTLFTDHGFMPRWIEAVIRRGLERGWRPEARTADVRLETDASDIIQELEEPWRSLPDGLA